ncbi:MAG: spermidine synthase [Frankiales bacterium]|nr:spermidine synthase [Frankiales bacterium]
MSSRIEELDWQPTPIGEISLRRRVEPTLGVDVFEVRLGEEFLMSSLFTVAEVELARLGLAACGDRQLDVVVGGLGLGWTAREALQDSRVRSLTVVETLGAVIGWHQRGLLPHAAELVDDQRTTMVEADFFALAAAGALPGPSDAVLLDVDHSPRHVLHPSHAAFYSADGLRRMTAGLHPGGVLALWSDDPPDEPFQAVLAEVFATTAAHVVPFPNHHTGGTSTNTVYVATTAR